MTHLYSGRLRLAAFVAQACSRSQVFIGLQIQRFLDSHYHNADVYRLTGVLAFTGFHWSSDSEILRFSFHNSDVAGSQVCSRSQVIIGLQIQRSS